MLNKLPGHPEEELAVRYLHLIKLALTRGFDASHYDVIPRNSRTLAKRLRSAAYAFCQGSLAPGISPLFRPTGQLAKP